MAKAKKLSGGASLKKLGKRPVLLGLAPADHDTIRAAADLDGRPVTQFLLFHGLAAARKLLRERGKEKNSG